MRVKLQKSKQSELILATKRRGHFSWTGLAKSLGVARTTLKDWEREKNLLPFKIFKKLDSNKEYRKYLIEYKDENWGQCKGGKNTKGNMKDIDFPQKSERLAELCGILLGDGSIYSLRKNKKIGVYHIKIAGDSRNDIVYLKYFVRPLIENLFSIKVREYRAKNAHCHYIIADGLRLIQFLNFIGLNSGNKVKNNQGIPEWILKEKTYLRACIRGLFDTDGSIYRMSKRDKNLLRIAFKSYIPRLLKEVYDALILFDYHPTLMRKYNQLFISRQEEVKNYVAKIGFHNEKHLNRIRTFTSSNSPVV